MLITLVGTVPLAVGIVRCVTGAHTTEWAALYAIAFWMYFVSDVIAGSPTFLTVGQGLFAAFYTWLWWRNRRKGRWKRAAKELGAKSRARVEALVEQMTPSPIPVPAGAR